MNIDCLIGKHRKIKNAHEPGDEKQGNDANDYDDISFCGSFYQPLPHRNDIYHGKTVYSLVEGNVLRIFVFAVRRYDTSSFETDAHE
ncbi:MAG: hypothetical protein COX70_02575 [Flavobacteriales bacterium CG_4_10_14_0_2_um_filter_32_8]|nr:MAG: hypothetical protein COX70_02575 [Flavobacteriales bacterium CG_4_10_14_0_2_um_filter_32_8]